MSIVDAARDAAERLLLLNECSISRFTEPTFNEENGEYEDGGWNAFATEVACNVTPFTGAGALEEQFGGEAVHTRAYRLAVPWDTAEIKEEDRVEVTASDDPRLVGRLFRVMHAEGETFHTARRLVVEHLATSEAES